jgi:hypothetical protein
LHFFSLNDTWFLVSFALRKNSSNPCCIGLTAIATYSDPPPFSHSNLHCMCHYVVEGMASEVPKVVFFPEVLYTIHATVTRGQSIQWRQPSLGSSAKGKILQHRRRSTYIGASCTFLKIQLPRMGSDLSKRKFRFYSLQKKIFGK